ncbi:MAG: GGDEF domain-containing protein [Motiliproteus sp.]|nr:GGDEF domain-containing protein [Motiliproteus sp.]
MLELFRPLRYLWLPFLLIIGYYYSAPLIHQLESPWNQLLPWLPSLLSLLILLLAWRFHSHRAAIAAALLMLVQQWQLSSFASVAEWQHGLLALIPANLALLAFSKERSLLSLSAAFTTMIILLQAGAFWWLYHYQLPILQHWLQWQPESIDLLPFQLPYPFTVMLVQLLAGLAVFFNWLKDQQLFNSYLLFTLIASSYLICTPLSGAEQALIISLALLMWLLLLFSHSHDLAYLDDLTGLPGRRALNQRLQNLGRRHCIAMTDIDHFKRFNDTYGHDVGDQVLKLVASKLSRVRMGTAYRYGGEEFCIVFAGKRVEQALPALEELRTSIEAAQMRLRSDQRPDDNQKGKKMRGNNSPQADSVSVTISIGVAERQPRLDTLKEADKALYEAKATGRNCVVSA